jgi:hypothetical protein
MRAFKQSSRWSVTFSLPPARLLTWTQEKQHTKTVCTNCLPDNEPPSLETSKIELKYYFEKYAFRWCMLMTTSRMLHDNIRDVICCRVKAILENLKNCSTGSSHTFSKRVSIHSSIHSYGKAPFPCTICTTRRYVMLPSQNSHGNIIQRLKKEFLLSLQC